MGVQNFSSSGEASVELWGAKAFRLFEARHFFSHPGFVITSDESLTVFKELGIDALLSSLDPENLDELLLVSSKIKDLVAGYPFPSRLSEELSGISQNKRIEYAVRSSAVLEDTPRLSFAGQYDSYLHVHRRELADYVKLVWASLYSARAISYRHHNNLPKSGHSIAVLIQEMFDGVSGVLFTVNPDTAANELFIQAAWNGVVNGKSNASTFIVKDVSEIREHAPYLTKTDVQSLYVYAHCLMKKFGPELDIEWVKSEQLGIIPLQVRPLTKVSSGTVYIPSNGQIPILIGAGIGMGITRGEVYKPESPFDKNFKPGFILVARDTSPDWEPLMRLASAIVTDHGCRTSHAALVAAEMALPAVVGTSDATTSLANGQVISLEISESLGFVFGGRTHHG